MFNDAYPLINPFANLRLVTLLRIAPVGVIHIKIVSTFQEKLDSWRALKSHSETENSPSQFTQSSLNCVVRAAVCVGTHCPAVKRFFEVSRFLSFIVTLSPTGSEMVVTFILMPTENDDSNTPCWKMQCAEIEMSDEYGMFSQKYGNRRFFLECRAS